MSSQKKGSIEVFTGPCFRENRRAYSKGFTCYCHPIHIFKPMFDTRYSETEIVSHNKNLIGAKPVMNAKEILGLSVDAEIIGIDEAQFFNDELIDTCVKLQTMAFSNYCRIGYGLFGKPFQPIPNLMGVWIKSQN